MIDVVDVADAFDDVHIVGETRVHIRDCHVIDIDVQIGADDVDDPFHLLVRVDLDDIDGIVVVEGFVDRKVIDVRAAFKEFHLFQAVDLILAHLLFGVVDDLAVDRNQRFREIAIQKAVVDTQFLAVFETSRHAQIVMLVIEEFGTEETRGAVVRRRFSRSQFGVDFQ